jgi:hypothetical protein
MTSGDGIKDPDHEAECPASMPVESRSTRTRQHGANAQGNDRGRLDQDPEGQQGGTNGGSKSRAPLGDAAQRSTGTIF